MQVPLTKTYKVKTGIAPEKLKDILEFQNSFYNLRSSSNQFRRKNKNTAHYDWQSVRPKKNLKVCVQIILNDISLQVNSKNS